jgi:hypothetical protein
MPLIMCFSILSELLCNTWKNEFNLLTHKFAKNTVRKWLEIQTIENKLYMILMTMSNTMNLFMAS